MNDENEEAAACGKFSNQLGTQFGCAYKSYMAKHGVTGAGCKENRIDDGAGQTLEVKICYCVSDGCNKNCICGSDKKQDFNADFNFTWTPSFENSSIHDSAEPITLGNSNTHNDLGTSEIDETANTAIAARPDDSVDSRNERPLELAEPAGVIDVNSQTTTISPILSTTSKISNLITTSLEDFLKLIKEFVS